MGTREDKKNSVTLPLRHFPPTYRRKRGTLLGTRQMWLKNHWFLSARGGARGASKYRLNGTFVEFVRHLCLVFWVLLYEFFGHICWVFLVHLLSFFCFLVTFVEFFCYICWVSLVCTIWWVFLSHLLSFLHICWVFLVQAYLLSFFLRLCLVFWVLLYEFFSHICWVFLFHLLSFFYKTMDLMEWILWSWSELIKLV